MKYIVTYCDLHGKEIYLFPKTIDHDKMMRSIEGLSSGSETIRSPLSAGFVNNKFECYGNSVTLRLESTAEDSEILLKMLEASNY